MTTTEKVRWCIMLGQHPSFKHPSNKDIPLWRYMDMAKFVSLIQEKALYFAKISEMNDPFEGSTVIASLAAKYTIDNINIGPQNPVYIGKSIEEISGYLSNHIPAFREMRKKIYANCWHMNEHESAAMWGLYSKNNEFICIKTSFNKLATQLPPWCFGGIVKYIDYKTEEFSFDNGFNLVLHKRKSFEHEREFRAVVWTDLAERDSQSEIASCLKDGGVKIKIDLSFLIDKVYVNPNLPAWFFSVIEKLIENYNILINVLQSSLSETPIY